MYSLKLCYEFKIFKIDFLSFSKNANFFIYVIFLRRYILFKLYYTDFYIIQIF